jgi:hypothetical protein
LNSQGADAAQSAIRTLCYLSANFKGAIILSMKTIFEWDDSKARINLEKQRSVLTKQAQYS